MAGLPQHPPQMPGSLIEEILAQDKTLALFKRYHDNVLLDGPRREEYRQLLADPEMMTAMADALMQPGAGKVEPKEHYHRLMQIDYLEAALTWKDNPQRPKVLELTGKVISKDNFGDGPSSERRQMLAGGKMELYRLMYEQDASKAQELVASTRGTRMEALGPLDGPGEPPQARPGGADPDRVEGLRRANELISLTNQLTNAGAVYVLTPLCHPLAA